jgi:hypothetical protein
MHLLSVGARTVFSAGAAREMADARCGYRPEKLRLSLQPNPKEPPMVLEMSTWPRRRFDVVADLRLDPLNVRLGLTSSAPQNDILQDLFQNERAFEVARGISQVGLLTHELPVVLLVGKQWIVVEGNRRTAALKGLLNPKSVPLFQARLAALAKAIPNLDTLRNIETLVAPNRDAANQLIATLHTSNARRPWAPLRQADFFYAQIVAGKSVNGLKQEYPGIDVASFVQMAEMHRLLQSVKYNDADLANYVNRKNFPMSVFDRLYANPAFLDLAKIEVDRASGRVSLKGKRDDFAKLANKMVGDIKTRRIDTRVLNSPDSPEYKNYLGELSSLTVQPTTQAQPVTGLKAPVVQLAPRIPVRLDVSGLYGISAYPATGRILDELRRIRYRDFPNATFDLIRTFLEKSIKAYAADLNVKLTPKQPGGFVYLDDALIWLSTQVSAAGEKSLIQPINRLRSKRSYSSFSLTKDFLDSANHNHQIFITPDEVRDLWDSIINILRFVLHG